MVVDTAIPCGLIINELVSNSLKHAFPPGFIPEGKSKNTKDTPGEIPGKIRVVFKQKRPGRFHLEVCDNGIGLPNGFDISKADSLGLKLVSILSEQLGGEMEYKSKDGTCLEGGTCFTLEFSEYHEAGTEVV
jgi:two-component sensor histidine kinase